MTPKIQKDTLTIGDRKIGRGHPAYIVAEIGINHNGDISLAKRTIDAAVKAGVNAVKFQNYQTEDFVLTRTETHTYISQGKTVTEPQYDMFKRYELGTMELGEIAAYCAKVGIDFHSTPTNEEGVAELQRLGVGVMKNGSDYLSHLPLIEAMARTGLPTVLSTGMATEEDIEEAVSTYRDAGGRAFILLHCVSQYPTPVAELNLRRIGVLRERFGCPVGLSDHSEGPQAAALAVALGACWIEKHFTLDRSLPGPDHAFSSNPVEMSALVRGVREAETALGSGQLDVLSPREKKNRKTFRLSCAAARDMDKGEVLGRGDIAFFRPGTGLPPGRWDRLVGRALKHPVKRGQLLKEGMLQ